MSKKNEPIGEVECPAKACEEIVPLFKFRPRPTENMRRMAGKLYCRCPKHGQFGGIGEAAGMQDYFLEKGTIWGPNDAGTAGNAEPEKPATSEALTALPPQKLPATPAVKAPAVTAPEPATPAAKKPWLSLEW